MTAQTRPGPIAALRGIWQRNRDLLHNASSLAGTTGVTSIIGFVHWIVAAREFSRQAAGYGAAAFSAKTPLGTIGMFGLGTMLIGQLPKAPRAGRRSPKRTPHRIRARIARPRAGLPIGRWCWAERLPTP